MCQTLEGRKIIINRDFKQDCGWSGQVCFKSCVEQVKKQQTWVKASNKDIVDDNNDHGHKEGKVNKKWIHEAS